jgi:hypothetical protein
VLALHEKKAVLRFRRGVGGRRLRCEVCLGHFENTEVAEFVVALVAQLALHHDVCTRRDPLGKRLGQV